MKKILCCLFSFGFLLVWSAVPNSAQDTRRSVSAASSLYVVSAKPGGVNFVEGSVVIARRAGRSGHILKGDSLEIGDKITTGADGKAEILLNPGSFVRLGENTEFEFTTTSLEDLQLKLNRGSAIFEVITDNEFQFAVNTPKAKFNVVKTGVYRVDVLNGGGGRIEVWKGKAQVGDVYATEVKSGRQATVSGSEVTVAKFDRDDKDALEIFSKGRAKELAKANEKLQNRDVRTSLMSSFYRTGWNTYNSYGLWVFNPGFGSYCFLPFGYSWNSPYGYYYHSDIWYYNLPRVVFYPPAQTTPNTPVNPADPANSTIRVDAAGTRVPRGVRGDDGASVRMQPPSVRVQNEIGRIRPSFGNDDSPTPSIRGGNRGSSGSISIPTSSASPSSEPPPLLSPGTSAPRRGN